MFSSLPLALLTESALPSGYPCSVRARSRAGTQHERFVVVFVRRGLRPSKRFSGAATFGMTWRCITCAGVSGHYLCRCLRTLLVPVPQGFWAITPPILVHHQCAVWVPRSRLDGFLTIYVVTSPASRCRRCKPRLRSRENDGLVPQGFPRSCNQPREVPCRPPIRNH